MTVKYGAFDEDLDLEEGTLDHDENKQVKQAYFDSKDCCQTNPDKPDCDCRAKGKDDE